MADASAAALGPQLLRPRRRRFRRLPRSVWLALLGAVIIAGLLAWAMRAGWDPRRPFVREAPEVKRAIVRMKAGDYDSAQKILGAYLATGSCSDDGKIGLSDQVRKRPDGSFDLGLTLFALAEKYGGRFGEEDAPGPKGGEPVVDPKRSHSIDCALTVVLAIASDDGVPVELRARAFYLAGNLEFLRRKYEDAVHHYDSALELIPGIAENKKGDAIGSDAAWNRAIALRRIEQQEEKKKKEDQDKKNQDQNKNQDQDKKNQDQDKKNQDQNKKNQDQDKKPDQGDKDKADQDNGKGNPDKENSDQDREPGALKPPPQEQAQPDSRMLGDLRDAPSYQQENAKKDAARLRRGAVMEDK